MNFFIYYTIETREFFYNMKKSTYHLIFIGAGVMGSALAKQCITTGLLLPQDMLLVDRDTNTLEKIKKKLSCPTTTTIPTLRKKSIVVLAVKPQDFLVLAQHLAPKITPQTIVVSIMAGIKTTALSKLLGTNKLVRVMPNTPVRIGKGTSAWYANQLTKQEEKTVEKILKTTGYSVRLRKEHLLDSITAISGCGPAYIYYFMEQLIDEAQKLGIPEPEATMLVVHTFLGASALALQTEEPIKKLRKNVTSKGGATEVALREFTKRNVGIGIKKGIQKAFLHTTKRLSAVTKK